MDATLAVVCDYANYSVDGKLNILGVFQQVLATGYPTTVPTMYVVVSFSASPAEANTNKQIDVVLLGPDGVELGRTVQNVTVQPSGSPGIRSIVNLIVKMEMVQFPTSGDYSISILVGGEEKRAVSLRLL
jgi:uncharacterized protein DUF6941